MTKTRNVYFNPNPMKHEVGDCTVRACCVATGKSWDEVYRALRHRIRTQAYAH